MGYSDIGAYGGTYVTTPELDRLAEEGVRFTDFRVAQAVCTASRAVLMTGCYPRRLPSPSSSRGRATRTYNEEAVRIVAAHDTRSGPLFLYLAHSLPHVPLYEDSSYAPATGQGLYADVIAEIDAGVGALREQLAAPPLPGGQGNYLRGRGAGPADHLLAGAHGGGYGEPG